jgi:hypothetical protein
MTSTKKQSLAEWLIDLTKDTNKMVKLSAYKVIPEFLANYDSENIPEKLIQIYVNLIDDDINRLVSR